MKALNLAVSAILYGMAAHSSASIQFEDVTAGSGLEHNGASFGASWGDFNDDNLPDLWVGNHATTPDLFINNRSSFSRATLNLAVPKADMHGASWADYDNDGDQDLFIIVGSSFGTGEGPNQLLVNTDGQLVDHASQSGLDYPLGRGRTPLWIDWNTDGLLDILLSNEERGDGQSPTALFTQFNGSFSDSFPETGFNTVSGNAFSQPIHLNGTGPSIIVEGNPYPSRLYGLGNTPFDDKNSGAALFPNNLYGISDAAIADYNGDLLADVFVVTSNFSSGVMLENGDVLGRIISTNDEKGFSIQASGNTLQISIASTSTIAPTDIFIGGQGNHPTGIQFELSPQDATTEGIAPHTPGVDKGIYIGYDSVTELWSFYVSSAGRFAVQFTVSETNDITVVSPINFSDTDAALPDFLFLQAMGGSFDDHTSVAGLDTLTQCESVTAADFDNDMDVDLYMVCQRPLTNQANILFANNGESTFTRVQNAGGAAGSMEGRGDSVASADYNNDGFIDLFVTNSSDAWPPQYGPSQIFRNTGNDNHWLQIKLEGSVSNRDGKGAHALVTAGNTTQVRFQDSGMHYKTQNHERLHFGLGSNTLVEELRIEWPSGVTQILRYIAADQILNIVESAITNGTPGISGTPSILHPQNAAYTFIPAYIDPDGDPPQFSIANKPAWAVFDSSTGELSGTPGNDDAGITTNIVISVDDQKGQINSVVALPAFNLEVLDVNDAPIVSQTLPAQLASEGEQFGPLNAADYFYDLDNDLLFFSVDGLPEGSGLGITQDGLFGGTPNRADVLASPLHVSITSTDPSMASSDPLLFELTVGSTSDSNNDGIPDSTAIMLGLDPADPDADTDNDGIPDLAEIGDNPDTPADIDGDGRIDALEPGDSAHSASVIGALKLPSGGSVDISIASGETLSNAYISEAAGSPSDIDKSFGLLSYSTGAPVGGSVTVRFDFTTNLPANLAVYKLDTYGVYSELPAGIWRKASANVLEITVTDGDPLTDQDGIVNGSVDDPIALANAVNPAAGSTAADSSSGGCTIATNRNAGDRTLPITLLVSLVILILRLSSNRSTRHNSP